MMSREELEKKYQGYIEHYISPEKRWRLEKQVDYDNSHDRDLREIAKTITGWEVNLVSPLGITAHEVEDIKDSTSKVELRRVKLLQLWKVKKSYKATYGLLLWCCLQGMETNTAQRMCQMLAVRDAADVEEVDSPPCVQSVAAPTTGQVPSLPLVTMDARHGAPVSLWDKEFTLRYLKLIKYMNHSGELQELRLITELSAQWKSVAGFLGFDQARIATIESPGMGKTFTNCLLDVVEHWRNNGIKMAYRGTWRGMHRLLVDMELPALAQKLEAALNAEFNSLRNNLIDAQGMNFEELCSWLTDEGVNPQDVEIFRRAQINGRMFLMLDHTSLPDYLTAISDYTRSDIPDLQGELILKLEYSESLSRSEEEFCANIEKHMRSSGVIDRFLSHLVFVGFPASGKTTLIYRLLNLAISIEASSSTGVMDGIITVNIGEDKASMHAANVDEKMEKCLWHKVEFSLSCLRQMGMLSSQLSHTPSHVSQHREATDPAADHDPAPSDHGPATEDPQPMKVVLTTIEKTLQEKGYSADGFREILPYLSNKTTLYLSDTGGQVEFQELLPLLVAGCAIFLFLFPLNKDLDKPVRVSYRKKGGGKTNDYTSSLTIEELFLQTLSSIDSMQTDDPFMKQNAHFQHDSSMKHSSDFKHKPAVFVIGTHKDCLIKELGKAQAKKKIKTIEERIKELVEKHRYGELVMHSDPAKEKILFAVSNVDKNDKGFQKIRSRIMTLIRKEDKFHIEFPLSYLLASMHLDNISECFVKRSDFAKDVLQYGIEEEDIDHLLRFLHTRIGQIRYFPLEEIREDIVKEPQVLYDIVTHLITESFLLPGNVAQASEVKRGVYSVESFSKHTAVLETSRLITLLRELRIVAPFFDQKSKKQKLFIPCVLNHLENPAGSDGCETSMVQPLALIFERGHCPKGMFGVLLHYIITQHSKDWNLDIQTIFRDQVSFQVCPYNDVVTIKFHTSYLEVRYFPDRVAQRGSASTEKKICNKILSVLASGIKQATTSLHYSPERTKFDFGLVCTECHLAHKVTEGYTIKCPKQASSALPNPGSFWFKIPTYSFLEQLEEGGIVFLKKGSNPPKQFSVSSESLCSQHVITKIKGPTHRIPHVYLEQSTIIFEDILECDEGVYRVSSHNDVGSGQMSFELKLKRPTQYKFLQRYLKGVAGSSSTLEFSVDPPVPESTEHFLNKENGEAAPPWFEVKHDCIIFQDLEEGDKGKYIISCRDTEGELVEETLWLKVESSQPSALAAHGAPAHQPPTHQHHDNAQGYYPTPHNHPPPQPPWPPGMYYPPYGQQSQCPPPWQGPPPHQQWGYFQEPAASSYGAHNEFHQAFSPESHPTLVESCHIGCLMEQLTPCLARWERIADGLRFTSDETATISRAESMKSLDSCLRAVLAQWMCWDKGDARGSSGRATLEALKTAVKNAGYPKVANSLTLTH